MLKENTDIVAMVFSLQGDAAVVQITKAGIS